MKLSKINSVFKWIIVATLCSNIVLSVYAMDINIPLNNQTTEKCKNCGKKKVNMNTVNPKHPLCSECVEKLNTNPQGLWKVLSYSFLMFQQLGLLSMEIFLQGYFSDLFPESMRKLIQQHIFYPGLGFAGLNCLGIFIGKIILGKKYQSKQIQMSYFPTFYTTLPHQFASLSLTLAMVTFLTHTLWFVANPSSPFIIGIYTLEIIIALDILRRYYRLKCVLLYISTILFFTGFAHYDFFLLYSFLWHFTTPLPLFIYNLLYLANLGALFVRMLPFVQKLLSTLR